ncbi:MAG: N4-gp56 family major capsid protein [Abditibacteriota bacterium]|nr:N4-gp56 family major capsid protein [Abditibacteriota bacterium]
MPEPTFANYAIKYSPLVDERFTEASKTDALINKNYDFAGGKTVRIYSVGTTALTDYTVPEVGVGGWSRYGTPGELTNTIQELTLSQDKAFTFTVDKRVNMDTISVMDAGRALRREVDEVIIPHVDKYRLNKIATGAGNYESATSVEITSSNALDKFIDAVNCLTDHSVPEGGRVALISPHFYKCILLDSNFVKSTETAQSKLVNGQVGTLMGIPTVVLPTGYMPTKTIGSGNSAKTYQLEFMVTHPIAAVSPVKIEDYRVHMDPPGISGALVEGRLYFDCFVLNNKKDAIYVHVGSTEVA